MIILMKISKYTNFDHNTYLIWSKLTARWITLETDVSFWRQVKDKKSWRWAFVAKRSLLNFQNQSKNLNFSLQHCNWCFHFFRQLGVSDAAAKLVVRIKMNRSDYFSLNCSQGWEWWGFRMMMTRSRKRMGIFNRSDCFSLNCSQGWEWW